MNHTLFGVFFSLGHGLYLIVGFNRFRWVFAERVL